MDVAINYGLNYSYQQLQDGGVKYQYFDYFSASPSELEKIFSKLKRQSPMPGILLPEASLSDGVLALSYPFLKEDKLLFSSVFCREYKIKDSFGRPVAKRIQGGFKRSLTPEMRIAIAMQLCNIFKLLEKAGIEILNPSEDAILYDIKQEQAYFDVLPAVLPLTEEMRQFVESVHKDFYICYAGKNDHMQYNRYFLSMLLYRLLAGNVMLGDLSEKQIREGEPSQSFSFPRNGLFSEFADNCKAAVQDGNMPAAQYFSADYWKSAIISNRCVCGKGLFRLAPSPHLCSACGKENIGYAESVNTGVKATLIGVPEGKAESTEYLPSHFKLKDKEGYIFKLLRGSDSNGSFRCALLFSPTSKVFVRDKNIAKLRSITERNSNGTSKILEIDITMKHMFVIINDEPFNLYFNI
ncbi:MAG: hypothetical protein LBU32_03805 [Clostridiales bacterium]|nr:hypothetical protein [Clostridiales bacterium]